MQRKGSYVSDRYEYSVIGIYDDEAENLPMAGSFQILKSIGITVIERFERVFRRTNSQQLY